MRAAGLIQRGRAGEHPLPHLRSSRHRREWRSPFSPPGRNCGAIRVHYRRASDDRYAGGIAWCAFDDASHCYFGSGDSRRPGDAELDGNGRDATRVVLAVTDSAGNFRPFATGTFP
jgi:hypothetical protein